jgi:hypothetical protein
MIPDLVWIGNNASNRYDKLQQSGIAEFASQAAAVCCNFGNPELAVELLNQGLAVSYQQLLQLRDDSAGPEVAAPEAAKKFRQVSVELQQTAVMSSLEASRALGDGNFTLSDRHRSLALERDDLITAIRRLPGWGHFLRPDKSDRLRFAARNGPVIMLSCLPGDAHALVLCSPNHKFISLHLPDVSADICAKYLSKLRAALARSGIMSRQSDETRLKSKIKPPAFVNAESAFHDVLTWLWDRIVSPVFDCLRQVSTTVFRSFQQHDPTFHLEWHPEWATLVVSNGTVHIPPDPRGSYIQRHRRVRPVVLVDSQRSR